MLVEIKCWQLWCSVTKCALLWTFVSWLSLPVGVRRYLILGTVNNNSILKIQYFLCRAKTVITLSDDTHWHGPGCLDCPGQREPHQPRDEGGAGLPRPVPRPLVVSVPDSLPQQNVQDTIHYAVHISNYHVSPCPNLQYVGTFIVNLECILLWYYYPTSPATLLTEWWNMSRRKFDISPSVRATALLRLWFSENNILSYLQR